MFKGILGALLFVFTLIVFLVFLAWGYIIRFIRNYRRSMKVKADREEIHYRNETGRQRRQYSQRQQQASNGGQQASNGQQQAGNDNQQDQARRTQTTTGETIIDHRHQERENKKIFDDNDGEYVEFTEA
ncbi:MAG: DUF4834 family protein [Prevotella sp.]|nr:DUF4834 family protein [Prevotella sp.]